MLPASQPQGKSDQKCRLRIAFTRRDENNHTDQGVPRGGVWCPTIPRLRGQVEVGKGITSRQTGHKIKVGQDFTALRQKGREVKVGQVIIVSGQKRREVKMGQAVIASRQKGGAEQKGLAVTP